MKKSLLGLVTLLLLASVSAFAQTVTGKVTSATDGAPIPGVSVIIKGTSVGTSTDTEGKFTLTAPSAANDVLVISFIGFATQEISLQDRTNVDVVLKEDATELNEVVVTALGIEKDRKSLGYSITEVKGQQFTQAREINVANSLVGRVAGVNVMSINGGPGSSTSVLIRGVSSLGQGNQPLYVINGVPMSNESNELKGQWVNEPDKGDGISNLNPDDIESMTVLKGGAAAALYGSRAKAGVILITTKSGKGEGSVEFNSNYVFEKIMDLTDWQYEYGQGAQGVKPATVDAARAAGNASWGGRLDGSDVVNFDGISRPYVAHRDNLKNFYRTGSTFTNTVSFSKGFSNGGIRLSASDLHNKSVMPYSGLKRNTFNLAVNFEPVKRLKVDTRANFILDEANNRPMLSDGAGNGSFQAMFMPTSWDIRDLKPGTLEDGTEKTFSEDPWSTNPWFAAKNFINDTKRERFIGSITARYTFDNGFFVQGRVGRDSYTDRITGVVPTGTKYKPAGSISEVTTKFFELNADFLVGKQFNVGTGFTISPSFGGNLRQQQEERSTLNGDQFAVPFVYNIVNPKNKTIEYRNLQQEVQSFYGLVDLSYKNFLFLTATARNDWFSTLAVPGKDPSDTNLDILYPSVNGSFVFSEVWDVAPALTFGKIRAGYSKVGQGTKPYQTVLNYGVDPRLINGNPIGTIINTGIPNSALVPSEATEIEIGAELGFFGNRLRLDAAWYNKKSTNEIIEAPASLSSGYTAVVLNMGELRNKGYEFLITGVPVQKSDFRWTTSLNGAFNQNEVLRLADGQASLAGNTSRSGNGFTQQLVGYAASQVMAFDYSYDANGMMQYGPDGLPLRSELKAFGSAISKWTLGLNNEFSYKQFNLAFLIDGKFGGKLFSGTNYYAYRNGLHKETLEFRDGVIAPDGTEFIGQAYAGGLANNISSLFVYDASFIKFRQLSLGYTFPGSLLGNVVKSATLSVVGRNLFILMKKTDNIDPEAGYSTASPGVEQGGLPPTRTYGFNLNVKF